MRRLQRRPTAQVETFPAPTAGWISNENLARPARGAARVLENWFPGPESVRIRKGNALWADGNPYSVISDAPEIRALFAFNGDDGDRMISATNFGLYTYDEAGTPQLGLTESVIGTFTGDFAGQQINVSGGAYFFITDGTRTLRRYSTGAGFDSPVAAADSPAITGADAAATYAAPVLFKERMFFLRSDTLQMDYLPVDSVGGALGTLDARSVFRKGGQLLIGGSVSHDSGTGLDDRFFVLTNEGELAVYEGSNPGDANDWGLVGLYRMPRPKGPRAWMEAGGDVLIATDEGLVSVLEAMRSDVASLSLSAVSRPIEPDWQRAANARTAVNWNVARWDAGNLAMVAMPVNDTAAQRGQVFVVHIETGAWALWTGMNARCCVEFNRKLYWADDLSIFEADTGADDNGAIYEARCSYWPDSLGAPALHKSVSSARATFLAGTTFRPKVSMSTDYRLRWPVMGQAALSVGGGVWSSGVWDNATWGSQSRTRAQTKWAAVNAGGFVVAPQVQVLMGGGDAPEIELISMDVLYETGTAVA